MKEKPTPYRLLADEDTSHRLVAACRRLWNGFAIVHIAARENGSWLGLGDAALLIACAEHRLVLVAFDGRDFHGTRFRCSARESLMADSYAFRRSVRSTDYRYQARLLTGFWTNEGEEWEGTLDGDERGAWWRRRRRAWGSGKRLRASASK